jgi:AcrR family transcriptional regulator
MTRVRRTQAERTATTRTALLTATVECLVERGYRGVTTTHVAHRAGVSPGALLHHYPTKADLLCAAVGHLFDQRNAEFRKTMADLPPGSVRGSAAIDLLWSGFSGPTFLAVVRLDREFMDTSEATFRELFAEETAANPDLPRLALGLLFALMDGLALARSVPGYEPVPAEELLEVFKLLIHPALPTRPEGQQ